MKRSCRSVPQRTGLPCCGSRQNQAIERAQQQLLGEAHARVGRHFERAEFDQPEPPGRAVGRIELVDADFGAMRIAGDVDEQIAEQAVDEPERRGSPGAGDLRQRDFEFVELVVARLVDARRLAGRADEQAREQIGQRRVALPIENEALRADRAGAGTANPPASRRRARHDCRRPCRCGGRRS